VNFRFNFEKTLQAAGVLLEADSSRMERIRLLKLLYIADRESLAETGRVITGDRAVAMEHGPVLSRVYDLIKGEATRAGEWGRYIHSEGHSVVLKDDPGRGELTRREIEKLKELTDRYRDVDDWALSESTHEFPEWLGNHAEGIAATIPWRDALTAQGKEELVEIIERDQASRLALDEIFGR
jgi:uncharacterized phage-associated protein